MARPPHRYDLVGILLTLILLALICRAQRRPATAPAWPAGEPRLENYRDTTRRYQPLPPIDPRDSMP